MLVRSFLSLIGLAALATGSVRPAAASELVLRAGSNHIIEAHINGRPVRLRVDPESPGYIILNPDAALRVDVRPSLIRSTTIIGPVRVRGDTMMATVMIGGTTSSRRMVWTDRKVVQDAEGLIGPADLPFDRVVMQLHAPAEGERHITVPMLFERSLSLYFPHSLDGRPIFFRFSTMRRESLATAAAGALLAQEYGGGWTGGLRPMMIKYQITRPVRPLALEEPFLIAGRPLGHFLVRTSDHRGSMTLPSDVALDLDEIVVTAETGRERPRYVVSLGLDWLERCSSLTWDNRNSQMILSCAPVAAAATASAE